MAEFNGTLRVHQRQILVEWDIEEFSAQEDEELISEVFSLSDASWYISIYPNGDPDYDETDGCVCLYLMKQDSTKEYRVAYKMGIKKADGSVYRSFDGEEIFEEIEWGYGSEEFLKTSELMESMSTVAPDNVLRVFCFARLIDDDMESDTQISPSQSFEKLIENYKDLYLGGRLCDVTLTVKDKDFQAHKCILAARSSVFAAMFEHDTLEKRSSAVNITDCDPISFNEFLIFLYTGKLETVSPPNVSGLYETANKYDVKELQEECLQLMEDNLSVATFSDTVAFAFKYEESELLESATEFFTENSRSILSSVQWKGFLAGHPALANQLLIEVFKTDPI